MKFERYFSNRVTKYKTAPVTVLHQDGRILWHLDAVTAPEGWSELAISTFASKYFKSCEHSIEQVTTRISDTIRNTGIVQNYFATIKDAENFGAELKWLLENQYAAFNSPVFFNCGVWHQYGMKGGSGNWAWDHPTGQAVEIFNAYERPQAAACFILESKDELMHILGQVQVEGKIFKHGSGCGTNYSPIRSKGESLSNGGFSSGVMSFLKLHDTAAGVTKSGGITRRAARIAVLNIDHPEIMEFIQWKAKEEEKALALINAGYCSHWQGEAYSTVSGQNTNCSVRIPREFMEQIVHEKFFELETKKVTTHKTSETYVGQHVWDTICESTHRCGEPGIQFSDNINAWNPIPTVGPINSSNPCGEFQFINNSACNLASANLVKFLKDGEFNYEEFRRTVFIFIVAMDILVDLSSYPTKEVAENSHKYRPLGFGFTNLGALLMRMGLAYDSLEGRLMASEISSCMTSQAYKASIKMAEVTSPIFPIGDSRNDDILNVLRSHKINHNDILLGIPREQDDTVVESILDSWPYVLSQFVRWGIRNTQVTCIAPTGTISLVMDCDTTGIEPEYALVKYKSFCSQKSEKIVNSSVKPTLLSLGYSFDDVQQIVLHITKIGTVWGSALLAKHLELFDCAMPDSHGRFIRPSGHIEMMAAVQPFISGAISKTINVPRDATVHDISGLYKLAFVRNLKCITIYRDGCKNSQVLTVKPVDVKPVEKLTPKAVECMVGVPIASIEQNRRKLPSTRSSKTIEAKIGNQKLFLTTGEYADGTIGEVFINMSKGGASFGILLDCFCRAISLGLQYGVPFNKYVKHFQHTRFEPAGMVYGHRTIRSCTSIIDYIFNALQNEYGNQSEQIDDPIEAFTGDAPMCDNCGHLTIRCGACYQCKNCGMSMGCG